MTETTINIQTYLDKAFLEAGKKIVQCEIVPVLDDPFITNPKVMLSMSTTLLMVPQKKIIFQGDSSLCKRIAEKMKRIATENTEETMEYIKEFLNIVYGSAISSYNRNTKKSIYLDIPQWLEDWHYQEQLPYVTLRCYKSALGYIRILFI